MSRNRTRNGTRTRTLGRHGVISRRNLLVAASAMSLGWRTGLAHSAANTSAVPGPAAPARLRIGFQKSAVNLVVLKQQRALETRFATAKLQWVEFPAGPQLLEALSVGSLEFGLTGDTPPVFAQAAGRELLYVGAEPPKPLSSAVLVPAASPLRTLGDLRGKRIALQRGSSAHYLLVRAVARAGLQWHDIEPIYLPPSDARAAFEKGAVDAWVIWDPYYAATELDIQPRVLATGAGFMSERGSATLLIPPRGADDASVGPGVLSNNNSFYLASKPFVAQYAGAVQGLLEALTQADAFVQSNRSEAARLIADFSGLRLATVHLFLSRRPPSPAAPLGPTLIADQQRVADAFHQQGLIPHALKVADIVWAPPRARLEAPTAS